MADMHPRHTTPPIPRTNATAATAAPPLVLNDAQREAARAHERNQKIEADQKALSDWAKRARGESTARDEEQARRDWNAGIFDTQPEGSTEARKAQEELDHRAELDEIERRNAPAVEPPSDGEDDGLNFRDPWDEPGAVNRTEFENEDPFSKFRRSDGFNLETPVNGPEVDPGIVADFGSVAKHVGLTYEAAETLVANFINQHASDLSRRVGPEGSYDQTLTVSELRFEWGTELEPTLSKIEKFCEKHPSLSTYLDATGLGDSPEVLRMLAGAATVGTTPAAARAFIDKVKKDPKHGYWKGDRLALAQMKYAYAIAGEK